MAQVACPTCKRVTDYSPNNPWRPFCSERCKLIDLGGWLSEQNSIPGEVVGEADADIPRKDRSN